MAQLGDSETHSSETPAATPVPTVDTGNTSPATSPITTTTTSLPGYERPAAQPIPVPGTPPPPIHSNSAVDRLKAIFPDFDISLLESVLESVRGDEDRAVDVLLGMSDPSYVSQVRADSGPSQVELDEELARRLLLEESDNAQPPGWNPQWNQQQQQLYGGGGGRRQQQRQGGSNDQQQGGGMQEFQEQLGKLAESGKRTFTNLFNKAKAKFEELDSGRPNQQQQQQQQEQSSQWQGQDPTYYVPPSQSPPPPVQSQPMAPTMVPHPPSAVETRDIPAATLAPPPQASSPAPSGVDPSRIGLIPKRPVSLLGPKTPPPASATKPADDNELDYVENPFEEEDRHRSGNLNRDSGFL